jgi:hypothetical protein
MDGADEPEPEIVTDGVVTIERDHACFRALSWRTTLARSSAAALRRALATVGEDLTRDPRLVVVRVPPGHHVIVVVESGRVQLRLDLASEPARRARTALALARAVADAVARG